MTRWRVGIFIVGLIFAAPFIALNVWGMKMSTWSMNLQTDAFEASEARENKDVEPKRVDIPKVPTAPWQFLVDMGERRRNLSETDFNDKRTVSVSEVIELADVLQPGEAVPKEAFHALFVEARAGRMIAPTCAEVISTIATKCVLHSSETRALSDGRYAVTAKLRYLPNYTIGQIERAGGSDFLTTTISLNGDRRNEELPAVSTEMRETYLQKARDLCDILRSEYGNCIVSNVSLDVVTLNDRLMDRLPAGTNPIRLGARARLSVYGPDARPDREALRQRGDALEAEL